MELKSAYEEAKIARLEAFVKGKSIVYRKEEIEETDMIPTNFPEQFVQCIGTERFKKDMEKLETYLFYAHHGKITAYRWISNAEEIMKQFYYTYGQLMERNIQEYKKLVYPLHYNSAVRYMEDLEIWLNQIRVQIAEEFDDHYKREQIQEALQFIEKNYSSNLNMAVVSNYVSMNYSLFSISFKQYTGINFVNYLKNIRIKEAKYLLQFTDERIAVISKKVGYDNEKHFMKTFKGICGVSPSDYRKNIHLGKKKTN